MYDEVMKHFMLSLQFCTRAKGLDLSSSIFARAFSVLDYSFGKYTEGKAILTCLFSETVTATLSVTKKQADEGQLCMLEGRNQIV